MKTLSASDNAALITRQSMLVLLSAGAFFICGSYIIDGFGDNDFPSGGSSTVSRLLGSHAGQFTLSGDASTENVGGCNTAGSSFERLFGGSGAGLVLPVPPGPYSYSIRIPVNPFKYESHFGFSPLRSPPLFS